MSKLYTEAESRFTTENRSICGKCKHFDFDGKGCVAYPDGIPFAVLMGEFQHTKPYPWEDDHGILFEPKEAPVTAST